jgi:hypothetical protein
MVVNAAGIQRSSNVYSLSAMSCGKVKRAPVCRIRRCGLAYSGGYLLLFDLKLCEKKLEVRTTKDGVREGERVRLLNGQPRVVQHGQQPEALLPPSRHEKTAVLCNDATASILNTAWTSGTTAPTPQRTMQPHERTAHFVNNGSGVLSRTAPRPPSPVSALESATAHKFTHGNGIGYTLATGCQSHLLADRVVLSQSRHENSWCAPTLNTCADFHMRRVSLQFTCSAHGPLLRARDLRSSELTREPPPFAHICVCRAIA